MRPGTVGRALLTATAFVAAPAPRAADAPPPLEALRLLPPVLMKGDAGWSLAERMRHHKVEAVSVALVRDYRVVWEAAVGLADREEGTTRHGRDALPGGVDQQARGGGRRSCARRGKGTLRLDADVNDYLRSWKVPESELTAPGEGHAGAHPLSRGGADGPRLSRLRRGRARPHRAAGPGRRAPGEHGAGAGRPRAGVALALLGRRLHDRAAGDEDTLGQAVPRPRADARASRPAGMSLSTYEQPLPAPRLARAAAGYRRDGSPVPGKRHVYPEMAAAGLWTTAGDLARFAVAIQKSLRGDAGSLLLSDGRGADGDAVHRRLRPRLRRRDARGARATSATAAPTRASRPTSWPTAAGGAPR